jgi:hypothetical protein
MPAANCVTQAHVSVNPGNWRAGYGTDWASNLPFCEPGLSENYQQPPARILLFRFQSDALLAQLAGPGLAAASEAAEGEVRAEAAKCGLPVDRSRGVCNDDIEMQSKRCAKKAPRGVQLMMNNDPQPTSTPSTQAMGLDVGTSRIVAAQRQDKDVQFRRT